MIQGVETLTVVRKTENGTDLYGNPTFSTTQITISGCLAEIGMSEVTQELFRDVAKVDITIYAPNGSVFEETDSFIFRGKDYRLSEEPKVWVPFANSIVVPRVIIGLERYNG